jgi:hypothetical protein
MPSLPARALSRSAVQEWIRVMGAKTAHIERGAAADAQVTLESLIAEAEAARAKAMEEKGGAAAAVSALIAKAKLAGMWREKIDQHNTGTGTVSTVWQVSWDEEGEQSDGREAG